MARFNGPCVGFDVLIETPLLRGSSLNGSYF